MTDKRLTVHKPVLDQYGRVIDIDFTGYLDAAVNRLQALKLEHADKELYLEPDRWTDDEDYALFELHEERLETDEEMKARLHSRKLQENHERAQYERLRAKFGDK